MAYQIVHQCLGSWNKQHTLLVVNSFLHGALQNNENSLREKTQQQGHRSHCTLKNQCLCTRVCAHRWFSVMCFRCASLHDCHLNDQTPFCCCKVDPVCNCEVSYTGTIYWHSSLQLQQTGINSLCPRWDLNVLRQVCLRAPRQEPDRNKTLQPVSIMLLWSQQGTFRCWSQKNIGRETEKGSSQ